ncbi:hypothetical protein [Adlercreutzia sp. ZJ138]|uniref:hypothetical protein n=1 Tax=Adlercreutzia sp. ZJ138 TaxID=2709405 RepID=UPI0013E9EBA5|nr:hypothetical protein [Adlercreutzia sp. ZJ138]
MGDYVIFAANTYVIDTDIPSGSLVFGQSPNLIIKEDHFDYVREYAESVFIYDV